MKINPSLLALIFLSCLPQAQAASVNPSSPKLYVYKIEKKNTEFDQIDSERLMISRSCRKKKKKPEAGYACMAYDARTQVSLKMLDGKLTGGRNPGAVLCHLLPKADVVIGVDSKGNENSFCRFPDKTLIDCASLHVAARKASGQ